MDRDEFREQLERIDAQIGKARRDYQQRKEPLERERAELVQEFIQSQAKYSAGDHVGYRSSGASKTGYIRGVFLDGKLSPVYTIASSPKGAGKDGDDYGSDAGIDDFGDEDDLNLLS